jgi:hypothetical protein
MTTAPSRQFAHRRLRRSVEGLRALREELRIVEEQLAVLDDDARDAEVRALVAETPAAAAEMHDASRHAEAMRRQRDHLAATIAETLTRQDELLDSLGR